ncbi:MAG: response regulator transcription factor [Phycisphaerales bacterium]|nr:response regulator transcription factor [Phycisphaerales bacterium]
MTTRVLLVDDHAIFTDGLRVRLNAEDDLEVVGETRDGRDAVRDVADTKANVVFMDISMPGMNGIEATREIAAQRPGVKVICLSMHSERQFVQAALEAGASGYLLKDCAPAEAIRAIRAVIAGQVYLSPAVAGTVVEAMKNGGSGADASAFTVLTDRERSVLQLIAEGNSTRAIAERLHLSIKTIGTHREHIMHKLDIHSVAGLTKYAIREGLTTTGA